MSRTCVSSYQCQILDQLQLPILDKQAKSGEHNNDEVLWITSPHDFNFLKMRFSQMLTLLTMATFTQSREVARTAPSEQSRYIMYLTGSVNPTPIPILLEIFTDKLLVDNIQTCHQ